MTPLRLTHNRRRFLYISGGVALALHVPQLAFAQSPPLPSSDLPELAGFNALAGAKLAGEGKLTMLSFEIYTARLWVTSTFVAQNYAMHPFALSLKYARDFTGESIAQRSIYEMQRGGTISDAKSANWLAQMRNAFPDVKKNDVITGINKPGVGAAFFVNGQQSAEIRDTEFARLFFGIWLGPKTSEPALRQSLLAQL